MNRSRQQTFGARIKARREHLRLSQQQIADQLGLGRATYAHYETGRSEITALDLERLAQVLTVPISYFFGDDGQDLFREDEVVSAAFRDLEPHVQSGIKAMILEAQRARERSEKTFGKKAE